MLRAGMQVLANVDENNRAAVAVIESVCYDTENKSKSYTVRLASGARVKKLTEDRLLVLEASRSDVPSQETSGGSQENKFELPDMTASEDQNFPLSQLRQLDNTDKKKRQRVLESDGEDVFEEKDDESHAKHTASIRSQSASLLSTQNSSHQKDAGMSTIPGSLPETQMPEPSQNQSLNSSMPSVSRILASLSSIALPQGLNGDVAKHLMDMNRPLNATSIAQSLKEKYTRSQIDRALAYLVSKGLAESIDDSSKIFWFSQVVLDQALAQSDADVEKLEKWIENSERMAEDKISKKSEVEARVKQLILAPSDAELASKISAMTDEVRDLEERVKQVDKITEEAAKLGKSFAEFSHKTTASLKAELSFYKRVATERKRKVMELVDRVCESKNLKNSGRRDLIEQVGIELD